MRFVIVEKLIEQANKDKDLFVVTPDMSFGALSPFVKAHPDRIINTGIAEQNAVSIAAGMALSGKKPYIVGIIPFVTLRCFEQLRTDVSYMNTNVKIIGFGAGFEYGAAGATHHGTDDLAAMRILPNMIVCGAGDNREMAEILEQSFYTKSPMYMRVGRHNKGIINNCAEIKIGKASILEQGTDIAVIAISNMLPGAKQYAEKLKQQGRNPYLISMHTIKPIDKDLIVNLASKGTEIHTLEEHTTFGGLGTAVQEIVAESGFGIKFKKIGIPDTYSHYVGNQNYIRKQFTLNFED